MFTEKKQILTKLRMLFELMDALSDQKGCMPAWLNSDDSGDGKKSFGTV